MAEPPVAYVPLPDNTLEAEISTLATVYRFVLDCHTKKEAALDSRPNDATERSKDVSSATQKYTG
jgi:hypothetical protein